MSIMIKGLNTGLLLHEEKFLAVAIKLETDGDKPSLYYMQATVLKDFLMLLQNRLVNLSQKENMGIDEFKLKIENANKEMAAHIPDIQMSDVQQPNLGLRVVSFSVSSGDEGFNILLSLQNGEMSHIRILDSQLGFILIAVSQTLNNLKDQSIVSYFYTGIDFLPLYDILFQPDGSMDYGQYQFDSWKADIFNNCYLIIFQIKNGDSSELLSGGVLKTNVAAGTEELNNIAKSFCALSKKLQQYQPKIINIYTQPLLIDKKSIPSIGESLQPLADFYKSLKKRIS
ncbi:YjeJ-like uncharacterized protein [Klebsiella oxytoca]|uniref:YjeJ-like uncharacterized protein n=1 Tax=Klebsiella oxytoca TaxID=571 RepID=A0A318FMT3_KLEOX|nr:YjeJ family protein [Klebsiella oxytoca]PXW44445.1 YjeJ-like uncharacterized protein [Klebsiella oxytoca]